MIKKYSWIWERGNDIVRLFRNGWRDFRVRITRLGNLFRKGNRGIPSWLHQFLIGLHDLFGMPELIEFFFRAVTHSTPLTDEEKEMVTKVLGPNALRFEDIRVLEGGLLSLIFRLNGNFAFAFCHSVCMPRTSYSEKHQGHVRANRPIVMHELTHVYQYEQIGARYLGEAIYILIKTKRDCYDYGGREGLAEARAKNKRYADFNREQQAMIVQHYFTIMDRGGDTAVYHPFIRQVRDGAL